MSDSQIPQHKRMAMGKGLSSAPSSSAKFAGGGRVGLLKTGIPTGPLTDAKRANGIKGYKAGGKAKGSCGC